MKKKGVFATILVNAISVACLVVAVMFFVNNAQIYGASISSLYFSSGVKGSVSATYNMVDRNTGAVQATSDMTTSDGSKTVAFGATRASSVGLLNPNDGTITLSENSDVVLTYSFTADNTYYAGLSIADVGETPSENIAFYYSINGDDYEEIAINRVQNVKMEGGETTTVSIKIHIVNVNCDAKMSGAINWNLTNDSSAYDIQQAKIANLDSVEAVASQAE